MRNRKCEHGKRKELCRDCGGLSICIHSKQRAHCKECDGSAFCSHGKEKAYCRECGGSAFCKHDKIRTHCTECGGTVFCIHGKHKPRCKECGGSAICVHDKIKYRCRDCNGSAFCAHGKDKSRCKECGGSAFCEHNIRKEICKTCVGSAFCHHSKLKKFCKECGGSALCKTPGCETIRNRKYDGHCLRCFVHLHPDRPNTRNFKTKERSTIEFLQETFPHFTLVIDKKVEDGCSKRRPDVLIDFGDQVLCIEVDENMHIRYDCSCENKRLMELSQDVGHRPLIFLRFNPDAYINEKGKRVCSPWGVGSMGICIIKRATEWERRLEILKEQVQYWSEYRTEKTVEVVELFYDMNIAETNEKDVTIEDDGRAAGGAGAS